MEFVLDLFDGQKYYTNEADQYNNLHLVVPNIDAFFIVNGR